MPTDYRDKLIRFYEEAREHGLTRKHIMACLRVLHEDERDVGDVLRDVFAVYVVLEDPFTDEDLDKVDLGLSLLSELQDDVVSLVWEWEE